MYVLTSSRSSIVNSNLHGHEVPGGPVEISRSFMLLGIQFPTQQHRVYSPLLLLFSPVCVKESLPTMHCVWASHTHTGFSAVPESFFHVILSCKIESLLFYFDSVQNNDIYCGLGKNSTKLS